MTANHVAPTGPGTFDINGATNSAYVVVAENGSDCVASAPATATSGSVTIDSFGSTANTPFLTGSFNLTFDTGDTLEGTFAPAACSGLVYYQNQSCTPFTCQD